MLFLLTTAVMAVGQARVGEDCSYKLTYLSIPAVNIYLSIPEESDFDGRRVLHISAIARTSELFSPFYTLENRYDTWIDAESGLPLKYSKKIHQKTLDQTMTVMYDQNAGSARYQGGKFPEDTTVAVRPQSHNLFSLIYALRGMETAKGQRYRFFLDIETEPWMVEVTGESEEKITCAGNSFDAVKLRFAFLPIGVEKKRKHTDILTRRIVRSETKLWFWIAKESPRYFLKVEVDSSPFNVVTNLTELRSGKTKSAK